MTRRLFQRMRSDERGVTALEFGLLALPLFTLLLGGLDLGYQLYVRAATLGALERATRLTSVQTVDTVAIERDIEDTIRRAVPSIADNGIKITKGSFPDFSNINALEPLTVDINGNGILDGPVDTDRDGIKESTDCWLDIDNNGIRNVVIAGRQGIGGADQIVRYVVDVSYTKLLPVYKLVGASQTANIQAITMVRRQPYEREVQPPTRCKT